MKKFLHGQFRNIVKFLLVILPLLFSISNITHADIKDIWAIGDGEKIFKYNIYHPGKSRNSIWDGEKIQLSGIYNEVLGFQIIVELDSTGVEALEISMSPPVHKKTGKVMDGSGSIKYGDRGYIEIFTQHYLHVTRPTQPNWFYGSENSAPEAMTGWIPDALIPSYARVGMGGFPVTVLPTRETEWRHQNELKITPRPPAQNQGFWIDLYLPRTQDLPPGAYESTISVWENGRLKKSVPVYLEVVNAFMPDENHSNVWVHNSGINELKNYFTDMSSSEIVHMMKAEGHRHRIDLAGGYAVHGSPFNEALLNEYKPYLDGTAFQPQYGYHGPGQNSGEKIFPIGMYGARVLGNTKESVQNESDKWVRWFEKEAPDTKYFLYLIDEPGPVQFPWIRERADWVKSNSGPGHKMPIQLTREFTEEIKDAIDIWNAFDGPELDKLEELRKVGKEYWFYNGNRPRYGSFILEGSAVDMRVNGWIKYLYDINTWLIWESTHWTHNGQGPKGRLRQRVFNEPLTFINWHMEWGNGDGILFYPGRMPHQLEEDRGLNLAMPSIRLKNIRRGQQDYELLWLVEQKSEKKKAKDFARQIVVKAMSEVEMTDPVAWSQKGDDYDKVRLQLLEILKQ